MAFTAPVKTSNFELCPAGTHIARLVWLIDIGTRVDEIYGKERRQIFWMFELPNELMKPDENNVQHPFSISQFLTRSMSEKANLRKELEGWRGQAFTDAQAEQFDISTVVNVPAFLNVIHRQKQNGDTKAEINSIMRLPKGMECPPAINEVLILDLDQFDQTIYDKLSDGIKGVIQKSNEWQVISGKVNPMPPNPLASNPNPDDFDDDIPF